MSVPAIVLDGVMQYGSQTITINGVAYNLNNINIDRGVTDAVDQNTTGNPQRARYTHGQSILTAELQLATGGTVRPPFGQTFTITVDSNYGAETYVLSKPTAYEADNQAGNIRVANITAARVMNSITTSGTANS